mgnify:CR=1 FL=1
MGWREELEREAERCVPDRVFMLTDSNVAGLFEWPVEVHGVPSELIVVSAGEDSKSVEGLAAVWRRLAEGGATRRSLLVNIGGGVVCDLGGFAAATFKRGIRHINVPTTLLAMADAAIGGKTGIDFCGYKNEIGAFKMPERVIVDSRWLLTLSPELMADGFAEVVKSAMLGSAQEYRRLLNLSGVLDAVTLGSAAEWSARFKEEIVRQDPTERGLRRILNLGHTAGHAFETRAARLGTPVGHGMAVAHGLLVSLILSERLCGLPDGSAQTYADRILGRYYGPLPDGVLDAAALVRLMEHDKKNPKQGQIAFVLLRNFGDPVESTVVDADCIQNALTAYSEMTV